MKERIAAMGILALLLLSGCRNGTVPGESQRPSQTTPATPTAQPTLTVPPQPTPSSSEPIGLTAEELTTLAQTWCETYADQFAGYDAIQMSRDYWFADYSGAAGQVPFRSSDGGDGTIFFLPDPEGALGPAGAAAQLLQQSAERLILVDRARMVEDMGRRLAALEEQGPDEAAALDAFLENAQYTPALTEDTWYCVNVDDTGYLLMAYQGVYRLQRMAALTEYAVAPELQVRIAFDKAGLAHGWFGATPLPRVESDTRPGPEGSGITLYRVDFPGISSMLELRTYLKTLFSDEIVDALCAYDRYVEVDGVLYLSDGAVVLPPILSTPATLQVRRESDSRMICQATEGESTVDFVYERVGDRWLFTQFPYPAP